MAHAHILVLQMSSGFLNSSGSLKEDTMETLFPHISFMDQSLDKRKAWDLGSQHSPGFQVNLTKHTLEHPNAKVTLALFWSGELFLVLRLGKNLEEGLSTIVGLL